MSNSIYRDRLQIDHWYKFSYQGDEYTFRCGGKYNWLGRASFNLMELTKNGNNIYNREACYYDDIVNSNEHIVFTEIESQ